MTIVLLTQNYILSIKIFIFTREKTIFMVVNNSNKYVPLIIFVFFFLMFKPLINNNLYVTIML